MGLKEMLKAHDGKLVLVHAVYRSIPFEMTGNVKVLEPVGEKPGDVILVGERKLLQGPPMGQMPTGEVVYQQQIIPASIIYFPDLDEEDIILIKVTDETVEEAKAKLGQEASLVQGVRMQPKLPGSMPQGGGGLGLR